MPTDEVYEVVQTYPDALPNPFEVIQAAEVSGDIGIHSFPSTLTGRTQASAHVMKIQINQNTAMSAVAPIIGQVGSLGGAIGPDTAGNLGTQISQGRFPSIGSILDSTSNLITSAWNNRQQILTQARQDAFGEFKRAKGAIYLYIPNPMTYTNAMDYEDVSLTSLATDKLKTAVGPIPFARAAIEGAETLQKLRGLPINPKVEILFSNIPQRRFQYDFLFAPTSQQEADSLKTIIKVLRSESAPEEIGIAGIVWKAPSTFDISFEHNGVENTNIPKIQECVLEQVDVDYEPSGQWSTFWNGFPVAVRLQLKFREREPNHKKKILEGY